MPIGTHDFAGTNPMQLMHLINQGNSCKSMLHQVRACPCLLTSLSSSSSGNVLARSNHCGGGLRSLHNFDSWGFSEVEVTRYASTEYNHDHEDDDDHDYTDGEYDDDGVTMIMMIVMKMMKIMMMMVIILMMITVMMMLDWIGLDWWEVGFGIGESASRHTACRQISWN